MTQKTPPLGAGPVWAIPGVAGLVALKLPEYSRGARSKRGAVAATGEFYLPEPPDQVNAGREVVLALGCRFKQPGQVHHSVSDAQKVDDSCFQPVKHQVAGKLFQEESPHARLRQVMSRAAQVGKLGQQGDRPVQGFLPAPGYLFTRLRREVISAFRDIREE
jgi:hypothetical protein